MTWPSWLCRLVPYLGRRQAEEDLQEELRLHLELERERQRDAGVPESDALRAARRTLGNASLIRERTRDVWGWRWLDIVGRDVRLVARGLRRSPGFTAIVVAVLGLGIGVTTAVFSLINGVLLSPLPFRDPAQLVTVQIHVREMEERFPAFAANLLAHEAWSECRDVCAGVAALRPSRSTLANAGEPRSLRGAQVTVNLFELLGLSPAIGRSFQAADLAVGGTGVAILTHGLWRDAFGGDPGIVGRVLTLEDERVEVIGVMPESFWLPDLERLMPMSPGRVGTAEIFRPLRYTPEQARQFGMFDYAALIRLVPGITADQALPELTALTRAAFSDFPLTVTPIVKPLGMQIVGDVRAALWWLLSAVGAAFIVACVNVASLLTVRGLRRRHELAVRSAVGGGTADLVRHTLAESALLAGVGGVVGVGVAHVCLRLAITLAPLGVPRLDGAAIDGFALAFAAVAAATCAVGCGIPPAWRASRTVPAAVLKADARVGGDRSWRRLGNLLVGAQVALTVVLLVTGGLLLASFVRVMQVDRGFDPASVVALDLNLPAARYDAVRRTQLHDDLLVRLAGAPGVASAGITQRLPLEGEAFVEALVPADEMPNDPVEMAALVGNYRIVSPGYFGTLGMVLMRGRLFTEQDRTRPVAVVTEQTASRLWPGQDPIGERILRGARPDSPVQVVGVVGDARILGLDVDPGLVAYLPYWDLPRLDVTVVARGETDLVVAAVREAVRALDSRLPVSNIRVLDDVLAASVSVRQFLLQATGGFAIAGLALVGLGVFGTVSQRSVSRRREFALRLTLGATRGRIIRQVCASGLRPVVAGLAIGLVGSIAAAGLIDTLLFGVAPVEPVVQGAAALAVLGLAVGACLVPAVRALRSPPAQTLREE